MLKYTALFLILAVSSALIGYGELFGPSPEGQAFFWLFLVLFLLSLFFIDDEKQRSLSEAEEEDEEEYYAYMHYFD
jgi:uncharacterized membrane protein YtjA (UPF0391 family)